MVVKGPAKPDEIPEGSTRDIFGRFVPGANNPGRFEHSPEAKAAAKAQFLAHMAEDYDPSGAALAVGISRNTIYDWKRKDPQFSADWEDVHEACMDKLESSLYKRALDPNVSAKDRNVAAIMVLNAHRAGYRQRETPGSGATQINFIFGKPGEPPALPPPPKQLPSVSSGDVIDLDSTDDALEGD
jgi:hypothetical protein